MLHDTLAAVPTRLPGYCVMSNHWHLVLWPDRDGQLARFMQRLTVTHVRRWVEFRGRVGWGSVYQGRYKSFPVQNDAHLLSVLRHVERNPLRADLVKDARRWRWLSLGQSACPADATAPRIPIASWPITHDWPYGGDRWTSRMEATLALPPLRQRGRPKGSRNTR